MTNLHPKQPNVDLPFVHGPSTTDATTLLPWLEAQREGDAPAVVQLPVERAQPGQTTHLAIAWRATVDDERIDLQLDDTALGISLADHWSVVPRGATPAAWLEGTWIASTSPPTLRVTRWLRNMTPTEFDAPKFARRTVPVDADPLLVAALADLGQAVPAAVKHEASGRLVAAGLAAVPLLLRSLGDGRPFDVRETADHTSPAVAEPSDPARVTRTVGAHCDALLYEIVTPATAQSVERGGAVAGAPVLVIADWADFWHRRSDRTLAEIHAELAPLVDAYWAEQGAPQRVD